jgi:Uncharacterized protein conserved in bacteria (DUF2188)
MGGRAGRGSSQRAGEEATCPRRRRSRCGRKGGEWVVARQGRTRALSKHPTQKEAKPVGRDRVRKDKVEFLLKGSSVRLREIHSPARSRRRLAARAMTIRHIGADGVIRGAPKRRVGGTPPPRGNRDGRRCVVAPSVAVNWGSGLAQQGPSGVGHGRLLEARPGWSTDLGGPGGAAARAARPRCPPGGWRMCGAGAWASDPGGGATPARRNQVEIK